MARRCGCGKRKFRDEIAAKLALADIQHRDSPTRRGGEQRAYQCDGGNWHLTSWAEYHPVIRGRAGRARYTTSDRATVRDLPDQEDPMTAAVSRRINTPADLIRALEDAGCETRPTSGRGTFVKGPHGGTITIPAQWEHGRGKNNVLASVRTLGIDPEVLAPAQPRRSTGTDGPEIEKFLTSGGRPTLAYSSTTTTDEESDMSAATPLDLPRAKPMATKADLDAVMELLETMSERITALRVRVEKLEKEPRVVAGDKEPSVFDRAREVRERIMNFFDVLPPNAKMNALAITASLDVEDKAEKRLYGDQLARLAELGHLVRNGEAGVGKNPTYSKPTKETTE